MNILKLCLGSGFLEEGDPSKGPKSIRIDGPSTATARFQRRDPFSPFWEPSVEQSPPQSPTRSHCIQSITDPSKGAKPVRFRASPARGTSPRRLAGRVISSAPSVPGLRRPFHRVKNDAPGLIGILPKTLAASVREDASSTRGLGKRHVSPPRSRPPSPGSPRKLSPSSRPLSPDRDPSPRGRTGFPFRQSPPSRQPLPNSRRIVISRSPRSASPMRRAECHGGCGGEAGNQAGHCRDATDPYACTHLTEITPITPFESTYRSHFLGEVLPQGIEAPLSSEQNMRRLYVHDEDRVLLKVVHYGNPTSVGIEFEESGEWQFKPLWAQRAGPRAQIYFNPADVKAAVITCGGLCPGLNDVIRQIVLTLDIYGVKEILGIQYGFKGFVDPKYPPVTLTRKAVSRIHMAGGSFLGVSRGTPDLNDIVDKLQKWNISFFFVIGGNGSHAGAHAIYLKCLERKLKIAVVGIPKTIDNDIQLLDKTFGFDTSVEEAQRAINAGFVEASSAYNGVAIVKLMGRQSGFIAMYATLASGQVDIVLIPEVPFVLEGENGVYNFMKKRLENNGLCVIVVAEGAGQEYLESSGGVDAGGNPILGDIGKWFQTQIKAYFGKIKMSVDVKYIDPTYMIRARPCNSSDHVFCSVLGQNAMVRSARFHYFITLMVHGAFAGYTDITIGLVNTHYVFLPIPKVIETPRMVDPNSNMWHRTVTSTGQPDFPPKRRNQGLEKTPLASHQHQQQPKSLPPARTTSPARPAVSGGDLNLPIAPIGARQQPSKLSIKIDEDEIQISSVGTYRQ